MEGEEELRLIEPSADWEKEYKEMLEDWQRSGEERVPFVLDMDVQDFPRLIRELENSSRGIGLPSGFVEHSTYWLVRGSRIVGVVNLRHRLNEKLLRIGGHIGYGIRPGERRKGYATAILAMALLKARERGIRQVLVTCDKDNTGSARTIQKNGGVLESEAWEGEACVQRYWIEVT